MTLPLSQNSDTKVFLVIFFLLIVAAQAWFGDVQWWIPVVNCVVSGVFAFGIQDFISRYRLGNIRHGIPFVIAWILLTTTTNFAALYLPGHMAIWKILLHQGGMLVILTLLFMSWQIHDSPITYIVCSFVIGILSAFYAPTLYWLLFLPLASFYMRSNSLRNFWSTLTGVALGVWLSYLATFFIFSEAKADRIIYGYADLLSFSFLVPAFSLQAWIFIGIVALLLVIYTSTSFLLNVGDSLRSSSGIQLLSTLLVLLALMTLLNINQLTLYFCLLSLLLAVQVTLHHANLASDIHEWGLIFILVAFMLLSILPILIPLIWGGTNS